MWSRFPSKPLTTVLPPDGEELRFEAQSMLAKDSREHMIVGIDPPMRQEQLRGLREGTLYWYLFGEISYEDIFENKRSTTFCLWANAKNGKQPWQVCHFGFSAK
jgi:hypothetical protein